MEEEKINDNLEDAGNPVIPTASVTEYVEESNSEVLSIPNPSITPPEIDKSRINVIGSLPAEDKTPRKNFNVIEWVALAIQVILALFTYLLFLETRNANKTSRDALDQTAKAVEESKRANSIAQENFELAQQSSQTNDSLNKETLSLSKQSLDAQIKAINESQRNFAIENQPYLQISHATLDIIDNMGLSIIKYQIINMGKYPAKIFSIGLVARPILYIAKIPDSTESYSKNRLIFILALVFL